MSKIFFYSSVLMVVLSAVSCSHKTSPAPSTNSATTKPAESKPVKKATVKTALPKVIVVNDSVAKRSVDGRYYYDLEGRRYWRNNRDGKYYLYYRGIFDNPDFNPPVPQ